MSIITLSVFLVGGQQINLQFKTPEAAEAARVRVLGPDPLYEISDDYGCLLNGSSSSTTGTLITDQFVAGEAAIEIGLLQARTNMRAQQRAANDPILNGTIAVPASGVQGNNARPFPRPRGNN